MYIFVGSSNPVKINAIKLACAEKLPEVVIKGFEVASGIAAQPITDAETRTGAMNRAKAALEEGLRIEGLGFSNDTKAFGLNPKPCLGIGLEGGVFEQENGELWNTVWICVIDQDGKTYESNGERFLLPESLASLIRSGKEMGRAMDELIGTSNIKHKQGMIGVITKDFISRTEMYAGLAKIAVGLWYGREWEKTK